MERRLEPKEGYARYATDYDRRLSYWDTFEQNILISWINSSKGLKVLDAGAGSGRISLKLLEAGAEVTALDISPEMLSLLRQKSPRITTVEGDMEALPFEDASFDRVFSSLAIVHLKDVTSFFDEVYRVLKDDGLFILVNIHYRKPLVLQDSQGKYTIQCYNHYPPYVRKVAEELAFGIEQEEILTEGDDVWVSQILVLKK